MSVRCVKAAERLRYIQRKQDEEVRRNSPSYLNIDYF